MKKVLYVPKNNKPQNTSSQLSQQISATKRKKETNVFLPYLKKLDPSISQLIFFSTYTEVFTLESSPDSHSWKKLGIEGSLFLLKKHNKSAISVTYPSYVIQILGQKQLIDINEEINQNMVIEKSNNNGIPMFMYQNNNQVKGIYFPNTQELDAFYNHIKKIINSYQSGASIIPSVSHKRFNKSYEYDECVMCIDSALNEEGFKSDVESGNNENDNIHENNDHHQITLPISSTYHPNSLPFQNESFTQDLEFKKFKEFVRSISEDDDLMKSMFQKFRKFNSEKM